MVTLNLSPAIISVLAEQAAKKGKSTKAYMESLLIEAAERMEDATIYEYLLDTQPEGLLEINSDEKNAFESKYDLL